MRSITGDRLQRLVGRKHRFQPARSAGSSPSQTGQPQGPRITGIWWCSSAGSSFGLVAMIAKLTALSPWRVTASSPTRPSKAIRSHVTR